MTRRSLLAATVSAALRPEITPEPLSAAIVSSKPPLLGPLRGEFVRYLDPLTEVPVVRITAPTSAALIPNPANHFISSRSRFLVFSSNRSGTFAPYRLDLRTAAVQQLAETRKLDTSSLALDATERHLFYIDNGRLHQLALNRVEVRTIAEGVSACALAGPADELAFIRDGKLHDRSGTVLADDAAAPCIGSPDGAHFLFARNSAPATEFWAVPAMGGKTQLIAKGAISFPFWSEDSSRVLFLRQTPETGISEVHESTVDGIESLVVHTSRFAAFSPNHDDSVFVGASASKAQPLILLTLRSTNRELALCEHHAGDAQSANPVFSPDNRRVYFQSTRDGKSALYSINTETFVEEAS